MPALDLALLVHLRLVRECLASLLASRGHNVVSACQTRNELFSNLERTPPHLVLIDLDPALPELNWSSATQSLESDGHQDVNDLGLDAIKALRTWYPGMKVLGLATRPSAMLVESLHQTGAHGLIDKDAIGLQQLDEAVEAISQGTRFFPLAALERPVSFQDLPVRQGALTDREVEVLRYIAVGADNLRIAGRLQVSERTVRAHVSSLYRKLEAKNRVSLALHAGRMGLKTPDL